MLAAFPLAARLLPARASKPLAASRSPDYNGVHMTTTVLQDATALSQLAQGLTGSEILRISAEITALKATGREICNLTVGDFSPTEFRIPARLEALIQEALAAGQTNYPPSDGVLDLRKAVVQFYREQL